MRFVIKRIAHTVFVLPIVLCRLYVKLVLIGEH